MIALPPEHPMCTTDQKDSAMDPAAHRRARQLKAINPRMSWVSAMRRAQAETTPRFTAPVGTVVPPRTPSP